MIIIERLRNTFERIGISRISVQTEEGTKLALILPVLSALGYDIFNPNEVVPEMDCDLSKKADKVDFAIFIDGKATLLMECKNVGVNLDVFTSQLAKYYVASLARFAILTNGIEYRFFTDLVNKNLMDCEPFFSINILNASENDLRFMEKFAKENFNESDLMLSARVMSHAKDLMNAVREELSSPSTEFVKMLVTKVYKGVITKHVIEEFSPMVRTALSELTGSETNDVLLDDSTTTDISQELSEAYDIITGIIRSQFKEDGLRYFNRKSFVSIVIQNKFHTICRLNKETKSIQFPTEDYNDFFTVAYKSMSDIHSLQKEIIQSYQLAYNHYKKYV